jgi:hypothetical protein
MDVNGGHDRQLHRSSVKLQESPDSSNVIADKMQMSECDNTEIRNHETSSVIASEGSLNQSEFMTVSEFAQQLEVTTTSSHYSGTKEFVKDSSYSGSLQPAVQTSGPVTSLSLTVQRANVESSTVAKREFVSTKSDTISLSDPICRTSPCAFTSTRHQSYGNLGTSAGVAGLSSTSATLAFLPLRASGELLKQGFQATSLPAVPGVLSAVERTDLPVAGSNSVCVYESGFSSQQKMTNLGVSGTAAAIWDRRTNFFSEPPKPVSFPAVHPRMICLPSSASSIEDRLKQEAAGNGLTAGGQSSSSVISVSKPTDIVDVISCEELSKLGMSCDSKPPVRSSYVQQLPPPPTPAVQTVTISPAMLTVEATVPLSLQRDSGILLSRCKESHEIDLSSMSPPGASPKSGGGDVSSCEQWYHSSPRNRYAPLYAAQMQAPLWESGKSVMISSHSLD